MKKEINELFAGRPNKFVSSVVAKLNEKRNLILNNRFHIFSKEMNDFMRGTKKSLNEDNSEILKQIGELRKQQDAMTDRSSKEFTDLEAKIKKLNAQLDEGQEGDGDYLSDKQMGGQRMIDDHLKNEPPVYDTLKLDKNGEGYNQDREYFDGSQPVKK